MIVKGVFIDTYGTGQASIDVIDLNETTFNKRLGVQYIDIQEIEILGGLFDVIFDDEFVYSHGEGRAIPSVYVDDKPVIGGPCFICKCNHETGDEVSLNDIDLACVLGHIHHAKMTNKATGESFYCDVLRGAHWPKYD